MRTGTSLLINAADVEALKRGEALLLEKVGDVQLSPPIPLLWSNEEEEVELTREEAEAPLPDPPPALAIGTKLRLDPGLPDRGSNARRVYDFVKKNGRATQSEASAALNIDRSTVSWTMRIGAFRHLFKKIDSRHWEVTR